MSEHQLPLDWPYRRKTVLHRDDYRCVTCQRRGVQLEVDHVVPRHWGGDDKLPNLQTLCRDCHIEKTRRENGRKGEADCDGRRAWREHLLGA